MRQEVRGEEVMSKTEVRRSERKGNEKRVWDERKVKMSEERA